MKLKRIISILLTLSLFLSLVLLSSCNKSNEPEEQTEDATEQSTDSLVRVIKVKKNIKKGTSLAAKDIEIVDIDASEDIPSGYIQSSSDVINRKLLAAVSKGDILTSELLSTKVYAEEKVELNTTITEARALGYVIVTDYIESLSSRDLSPEIQAIIDNNPNKTIYFPDGVYVIAKPIKTSSARAKSVSLHLSANAVIQASDNWGGRDEFMIQIGIYDKDFGMDGTGTNYYMYGGIIDCNGFANGVEISAGRELSLRNVTIKNAQCGLHVAYNEEYGSNDSDTEWLNIEGNGEPSSVGVQVDGLDNTLSNIRVSGFEVGVKLTRPGNLMHNIYSSYVPSDSIDYGRTKGFYDVGGGNWYDGCYSNDYRTAFFISAGSLSLLNDCGAYWSTDRGAQYAIETDGRLCASITEFKADFAEGSDNAFLAAPLDAWGSGIIKNPMFNTTLAPNKLYERYLVGHVVWSN